MIKIPMQKWIVGSAMLLALPALLPIYRKTLKPITNQGVDKLQNSIKQIKIFTIKAKHEMEDMWLEAQYDQLIENQPKQNPTSENHDDNK